MITSPSCPVCHTSSGRSELFLEENIDKDRLSSFSYSSRKEPEYMCHRLLRCTVCDLVYADKPPAQDELSKAYHAANYDSTQEASDAADSYMQAIQPVLDRLTQRISVLEIGAGPGVFLARLAEEGFLELVGVEPSAAAIAAAPLERRKWIREGIFKSSDFKPESFDLVCCFMTLEHVSQPVDLVRATYDLLRPGGAFVAVTHNYRGLVNRAMGRRSPIVDIEHLQLYSVRSIRELFLRGGYRDIEVRGLKNRYSVRYWIRLVPLPGILKRAALKVLTFIQIDNYKLSMNVGNIITHGYKI